MERLAFRGGDYRNTTADGLFALSLHFPRATLYRYRGFRPALALCFRSLVVTAMRTKRGKRGPFPPQAKGKQQQPHATSRQRKRRGALFICWHQRQPGTAQRRSGWLFAAVLTTMVPVPVCSLLACTLRGLCVFGTGVSVPLSPPDVRSHMVMAVRTEQGQKGAVSAPRKGETTLAPRGR